MYFDDTFFSLLNSVQTVCQLKVLFKAAATTSAVPLSQTVSLTFTKKNTKKYRYLLDLMLKNPLSITHTNLILRQKKFFLYLLFSSAMTSKEEKMEEANAIVIFIFNFPISINTHRRREDKETHLYAD